MRYNKQELFAIASQTSQNFDREGVIILKERQDSFFRRSEGYSAKWFRLRGNLLFYLKGPEPWYEPLGLIVLGNHQVSVQNQDENGHWPFQLVWENGACYRMGTFLESERTLWLKAMTTAPYEHLTQRMVDLQQQLADTRTMIDLKKYRTMNKIMQDFNEVPLCELSLSCDNLLCDANGTPPSPFAAVFAVFTEKAVCVRYGCTEVVEKCSNPNFLRTIMFRSSDGISGDVMIRIVVYDMREMVTQTGVPVGSVTMRLSHIQEAQRLRVPLMTTEDKVVGFVTFNGWSLEPAHTTTSPTHVANQEKNSIDLTPKLPAHRRSQSLPPRMGLKLQYPAYPMMICQNFLNPHQATYHFHSGLGGDITVREAMAEPSFSFTMPLQLLQIYIAREQELQDTMMAFAEVSKLQSQQQIDIMANCLTIMRLLKVTMLADDHVNLHMTTIKDLETARDHMLSHSVYFKPSVQKITEIAESPELAYVPINLHIQRLWAHNDSLNKKGFNDIITVGAFTAHCHTTAKPGGLIRLLQQSKDISTRKAEMTANSNRLDAEFDKLRVMKTLQNILVAHMDSALLLLYNGLFLDMRQAMAGIRQNVKMILDMFNIEATEEALSKVGWSKRRLDTDDAERKRADNLALQARLMEPGGIAQRSACAAAAIATVADLSAPTLVDHAVVTTSIADVVNGADRLRTAAGVVAGGLVPSHPVQAALEAADGEKADAKLAVTSTDGAKPAPANAGRAVAFASFNSMKKTSAIVRTRSEIDWRRSFEHISASHRLAASRSLSESNLQRTSKRNVVNNQSPRNDCGKNGKNMAGPEGKVNNASGVNAASTSEDSAPKAVESTSEDSAPKAVESTSEDSAPKAVESTSEDSALKAVESTSEDSAPKAVENTSEDSATEAVESTSEDSAPKAVESTSEDSAPKAVESTSEDSAPKAVENTSEDSAPKAVESTSEDSAPKAVENTCEDSAPKAVESTSEDSAPKAVESTSEDSAPKAVENTSGDDDPEAVENTSGDNAPEAVECTIGDNAPEAVDNAPEEEVQASGSFKVTTIQLQHARPYTSGKINCGKPRGCKNNRAPKPTKQARKEANRESLRLTPCGQAQEEAAQFERLFSRHVEYSIATNLDNVTLGNLLFNKMGSTKKNRKNRRETAIVDPDPEVRSYNLNFFLTLNQTTYEMTQQLFVTLNTVLFQGFFTASQFEESRIMMDLIVKLIEEVQKWARMAHTAMRIDTEPPAWTTEYTLLRTRRDICFSQALTAAGAGVLSWATTTPGEIVAKIVHSGLGPLLGFEGLLSLYAEEATMWGDMVIAVEDLHTLTFKFVTVAPNAPLVPQVTGSRGALIIEVPITDSLHATMANMGVLPTFTVTAVFFNIGINDKASLAESLGDNKPQYQSNKDNFERLFKYYHKYCQHFPQDPFEQFRASSRSKPLEEVMENLRSAVQKRTPKNVEVLQLASLATRLMHGVRFTSCKSAKDRTGMSVTLEQTNILSNEYHLADDERKLALDAMRSEGCRRENTLKNVGQRKFAFSKQQVMALPEEYRPPIGSYGAVEHGPKR